MTTRIGFIGVGGIAQVHLKNLQLSETAELVAVCDVNAEASNRAVEKFGGVAYTDFNQMISNELLDALFVCVPPFAHGDIEEKAAARSVHLFIEKPLGLDMDRVREKARIIAESGIITGTGYCLRYLDIVQEAKTYLQDRTIAMINGYYLTRFVTTPWWRVMAKSGGQLVEQTTHTVDLMRYFAGDVKSVYANMSLHLSQDIEGLDIYDVGSINLSFTSGVVGHVATTFIQPDHRSGVEILGRDFRVHIDGSTLTIIDHEKTITKKTKHDFYKEQDLAFLDAIRTGDRSKILAPYEEGMKTLAVTLAANESAATASPIVLR